MESTNENQFNGPINYIFDLDWRITKCSTSLCCDHVLNSLMCVHENCVHANFIKMLYHMLQQCKTRRWRTNIYTHKKNVNNLTLYIVVTRNNSKYTVRSFTTKIKIHPFIDLGEVYNVDNYFMDQ